MRVLLAALAFMTFLSGMTLAASSAICNTPMYDGICCDSAPTEYLWPSGNGCCYGGHPLPGPTCPLLLKNDAEFVSQSPPPATMTAGQSIAVSIAMKNNGTTAWTADGYQLGLLRQSVPVNPTDAGYTIWGANPQPMTAGETVAPGQSKTFSFQITAPLTAGSYEFQWQMAQQNVEWFGQKTPPTQVTVTTPTPSPSPTPTPSPTPSASPSSTPIPSNPPTPIPSPSPTPSISPSFPPIPSVTPTATPTAVPSTSLPPNVRPEASIRMSCPSNLLTTRNVTLATLTLSFGQATCDPAVELNVTSPKKTKPEVTPLGCVNGRSAFNVSTTGDGAYTVVANYSGSVDTCTFAIAGTPPQPTPEIDPVVLILTALMAGLAATARKK